MEEGSEAVEDKRIRQEYEAVCSKLNMDQASMEAAWTSYTETRDYYTLEVSWAELETSWRGKLGGWGKAS